VSIIPILNIIAVLGWTVINSITGAQALRIVSDDKLPMTVGMISMAISFVGYKWIHTYERYSWDTGAYYILYSSENWWKIFYTC
jgi:purine-cytosine permease-like protein